MVTRRFVQIFQNGCRHTREFFFSFLIRIGARQHLQRSKERLCASARHRRHP